MTLSQYERDTLKHLAGGPLTAGELELETSWPKSMVESALRTLLAGGKIRVTDVRFRGRRGGSWRPARVYQLAGAPA